LILLRKIIAVFVRGKRKKHNVEEKTSTSCPCSRFFKCEQSRYATIMTIPLPPRTPWPNDFPEVIVHGEEKARDGHPDYLAAKSGIFVGGRMLGCCPLWLTKR
jgi:hypothetical protein